MNGNEFADILDKLGGWSPGGHLWEEGGLGMYSPEGQLYSEHPELYKGDMPGRLEEWYGEKPTARTGTQGLTGGEFADILKSKEYMKMSPLEKLQVQRQLEEIKNLRAKEIREREEHATEERTKRAEQERTEEIQGILRSRRTPAQKVTALTVVGIPLSQARELIWGEPSPEREVEREPAKRGPTQEELLRALKPEEERKMRLVGGEWIPYPTEEKLAAIDVRGEEYRTRKLAAEKEREERERDIHSRRRMARYLEMGASGEWTQGEVIAQLISEGMSASEAAAATAHLPSRAIIEAEREKKVTAIGEIGREAQKEKRDREETKAKEEDLKLRQRGMQKRIMGYFDLYETKDWNKSELTSALAADGWKPQDVVSLTGHLPDDWDRKKEKKAELERAETKTVQHAKDVQTYWDQREKLQEERREKARKETEEKAKAEFEYKKTVLDRTENWIGLMRDFGFDIEDFVEIVPQFLSILDPNKKEFEDIAKGLGTMSDIITKNEGEIVVEFGKQFKNQCKSLDARTNKEGITDPIRDQCELLAFLQFKNDEKRTDLKTAKEKWNTIIEKGGWYFGKEEVPFQNEELRELFLNRMEKIIRSEDVENLMNLSGSFLDERTEKVARKLIKPEKEGLDLEAQLSDELKTALATLGEGERLDAMQALRTAFDEKTKLIKEPRGTRRTEAKQFVIGTSEREIAKPKHQYAVNLGYGDYVAAVLGSLELEEATKGWLIYMRSKPGWWDSIRSEAKLWGTIDEPSDITESKGLDILGTLGEVWTGAKEKVGTWLDWGSKPAKKITLPDIEKVIGEIRTQLGTGATREDVIEEAERRGISKEELFAVYPMLRS